MATTTDAATEASTPEDTAEAFAADPTEARFNTIVSAVRREYIVDDHDPKTSTVLSATGLAARLAVDALGYDASSRIDFDGNDEVTVPYYQFDQDDAHAVPIDVVQVAGFAESATDRTVRFRDGAGQVEIYVEVSRRDDEADE